MGCMYVLTAHVSMIEKKKGLAALKPVYEKPHVFMWRTSQKASVQTPVPSYKDLLTLSKVHCFCHY